MTFDEESEINTNSGGIFTNYHLFNLNKRSDKSYLLAPISYNRRIRISSLGSVFNFSK